VLAIVGSVAAIRKIILKCGIEAPRLPWMVLYRKPVCNPIDLAFDSGPLDRLIVVTTPKRHCLAPKKDNDITFRNTVVASYTNFGRMDGNHDFAADRLRWSRPNHSC